MELAVALDLSDKKESLKLLNRLSRFDNLWIKVGLRSYIRDGNLFLDEIKAINSNFKIFLDLKLYDIPNTMGDAAQEIADLNIDMFNIHATAGVRAMREVMSRVKERENRPIVLAVTALTSFDNSSFKKIYGDDIENRAIEFAKESFEAGLDGVVCSVYESRKIKESTSDKFLTLTPGIRPFGESSDDQKRVATLSDAEDNLVDFIVVGRPIYKAKDPVKVVEKILQKI